MIWRAYVETMELLDKHKPQAGQEQVAQGVKRKRWFSWANPKNNMPITITPSAALNSDNLLKFERYARSSSKFLRDVEAGCSFHRYTFSNPVARHLVERKSLRNYLKRGNQQLRSLCIQACLV
jgi:hypothetical protein